MIEGLDLVVSRLVSGDRAALDELRALAGPRLYALAARMLGEGEAAQAVVADTLEAAWEQRTGPRPDAWAWLSGIAHRASLARLYASRAGTPVRPRGAVDGHHPLPGTSEFNPHKFLEQAYFDGASAREIARAHNVPEEIVATALRFGVKALQRGGAGAGSDGREGAVVDYLLGQASAAEAAEFEAAYAGDPGFRALVSAADGWFAPLADKVEAIELPALPDVEGAAAAVVAAPVVAEAEPGVEEAAPEEPAAPEEAELASEPEVDPVPMAEDAPADEAEEVAQPAIADAEPEPEPEPEPESEPAPEPVEAASEPEAAEEASPEPEPAALIEEPEPADSASAEPEPAVEAEAEELAPEPEEPEPTSESVEDPPEVAEDVPEPEGEAEADEDAVEAADLLPEPAPDEAAETTEEAEPEPDEAPEPEPVEAVTDDEAVEETPVAEAEPEPEMLASEEQDELAEEPEPAPVDEPAPEETAEDTADPVEPEPVAEPEDLPEPAEVSEPSDEPEPAEEAGGEEDEEPSEPFDPKAFVAPPGGGADADETLELPANKAAPDGEQWPAKTLLEDRGTPVEPEAVTSESTGAPWMSLGLVILATVVAAAAVLLLPLAAAG